MATATQEKDRDYQKIFEAFKGVPAKFAGKTLQWAEKGEWKEFADFCAEGNILYDQNYETEAKTIQALLEIQPEYFEPMLSAFDRRLNIPIPDKDDFTPLGWLRVGIGCAVGLPLGLLSWY